MKYNNYRRAGTTADFIIRDTRTSTRVSFYHGLGENTYVNTYARRKKKRYSGARKSVLSYI